MPCCEFYEAVAHRRLDGCCRPAVLPPSCAAPGPRRRDQRQGGDDLHGLTHPRIGFSCADKGRSSAACSALGRSSICSTAASRFSAAGLRRSITANAATDLAAQFIVQSESFLISRFLTLPRAWPAQRIGDGSPTHSSLVDEYEPLGLFDGSRAGSPAVPRAESAWPEYHRLGRAAPRPRGLLSLKLRSISAGSRASSSGTMPSSVGVTDRRNLAQSWRSQRSAFI